MQAASILDVAIGTVRSRVSRGREALRKLMDRSDGTEAASGEAITCAVPKRRRFVPELEVTQNSAGAGLAAGAGIPEVAVAEPVSMPAARARERIIAWRAPAA